MSYPTFEEEMGFGGGLLSDLVAGVFWLVAIPICYVWVKLQEWAR